MQQDLFSRMRRTTCLIPFGISLLLALVGCGGGGSTSSTGQITIVKHAQPNDPQDFSFTSNQATIAPFLLDDDSDPTLLNQKVFSNLGPGNYTFTETPVSGWSLASIVCTPAGGTAGNITTGTASISLAAGDNITCVFTNTQLPAAGTGTLTIIKDAQPNDTQAFHFNTVGAGLTAFDLDDDGVNGNPLSNSKTFSNLGAGIAFTVTEDAVAGWTVPSIQCLVAVPGLTTTFTDQLNRTFTVNLEPGANVTCTFINVNTAAAASTFTGGGPTLQVSMIAMTPTLLESPTAFTSITTGGVTTANVTAGPNGTVNNGVRTLANPVPGDTLIGAVATLPSSIVVAGSPLVMTATSCGGTSGGVACPGGSLIPLVSTDFGIWAINNVLTGMPVNALITYSAFAGGTTLTPGMPVSGTVVYHGKMTGVLANTPVGGSDDVSGDVNLTIDFANNTISGSIGPGIATTPGVSTISPCVFPAAAPTCTYSVYAPLHSPALPAAFADIAVNGTISGNGFAATVTTPSIPGALTTTLTGSFYGANAAEMSGTFTLSETILGTPGPGLIMIGSFGAKP